MLPHKNANAPKLASTPFASRFFYTNGARRRQSPKERKARRRRGLGRISPKLRPRTTKNPRAPIAAMQKTVPRRRKRAYLA
jgi:hypothetical protein